MPTIVPSTALRNKYNDISKACHEDPEPIFVTKNGQGDLVVMSIEAYEQMKAEDELTGLLMESQKDVEEGKVRPFDEAMTEIRGAIQDGTI
jgi:prevent-host-death family protein